jgi:EpsI family protein
MRPGGKTLGLFIVALLLAAAALLTASGHSVEPQKLQKPLKELPLVLGAWRGTGLDHKLDQDTLDLLKPSDYLLRNYVSPLGRVTAVFIAFFEMQQEGQIIHSPRHCLPGGGWQISSRTEVAVPGKDGSYKVNRLVLSKNLHKLSVLYWYQGRGRVEADEYYDRLCLVLDGLFKDRSDGALVRLTSALDRDDQEVLKEQIALAAKIIPAMNQLLPPQ